MITVTGPSMAPSQTVAPSALHEDPSTPFTIHPAAWAAQYQNLLRLDTVIRTMYWSGLSMTDRNINSVPAIVQISARDAVASAIGALLFALLPASQAYRVNACYLGWDSVEDAIVNIIWYETGIDPHSYQVAS